MEADAKESQLDIGAKLKIAKDSERKARHDFGTNCNDQLQKWASSRDVNSKPPTNVFLTPLEFVDSVLKPTGSLHVYEHGFWEANGNMAIAHAAQESGIACILPRIPDTVKRYKSILGYEPTVRDGFDPFITLVKDQDWISAWPLALSKKDEIDDMTRMLRSVENINAKIDKLENPCCICCDVLFTSSLKKVAQAVEDENKEWQSLGIRLNFHVGRRPIPDRCLEGSSLEHATFFFITVTAYDEGELMVDEETWMTIHGVNKKAAHSLASSHWSRLAPTKRAPSQQVMDEPTTASTAAQETKPDAVKASTEVDKVTTSPDKMTVAKNPEETTESAEHIKESGLKGGIFGKVDLDAVHIEQPDDEATVTATAPEKEHF